MEYHMENRGYTTMTKLEWHFWEEKKLLFIMMSAEMWRLKAVSSAYQFLEGRREKWCRRVWQLDGNHNKYQDSGIGPDSGSAVNRAKTPEKFCACNTKILSFEIWYWSWDINVFCIPKQNSWLNPNWKEYTKPSSLPWREPGWDLHILCHRASSILNLFQITSKTNH